VEVRSNGSRAGDGKTRSPCARVLADERGVVLSIEPGFTDVLGWEKDEVLGKRVGELAHPDDLKRGLSAWAKVLKEPDVPGPTVRLRYRHRDGHWVWVDVTSTNRLELCGAVVTDMVDVSRQMALLDQLESREQLLAHLGDVAPTGLFHADGDGALLYASRRLEAITKVTAASTLAEQLAAVDEEDRAPFRTALQHAAAGSESVVELGAGERRWRANLRPVRDPDGVVTGVSGCVEDITDLAAGAGAASDAITGCLSFDGTLTALERLVKRHGSAAARRTGSGRRQGDGRGTAVLVVDLSPLPDQLGRPAKEELLRLVSLRIVDTLRASDLVGRTDDAEFAALCPGVPGPTTARTIGRSILKQVSAPIVLQTAGSVVVRPSIGVSWTSNADLPANELLRQAQEAAVVARESDPPEPVLADTVSPVGSGSRR